MSNETVDGPELQRALERNAHYARQFTLTDLPRTPARRLAILACMDQRLTVEEVLGLETGDAHIIRNAGGLATEDAIRSLVISQHLLGTEEIIVIEHTGCGMLTFEDAPANAMTVNHNSVSFFTGCPDLEAVMFRLLLAERVHPVNATNGSK